MTRSRRSKFGPAKNLLWKTAIPPGHSSPCVWDDRIFLTSFAKGKFETICIGRADGKILWRETFPAEKLERINGTNSRAAPTPATDGQRVYILFGSFGLVAYDFDGKEQWRRPLPMLNVRHGTATSPIVAGGKVIVNGDQEDGKSFLLAADARTGQPVWQVARPTYLSSHCTPVIWNRDGVEQVIIAGCIRVTAYDLKDGRECWTCRGQEAVSIVPTPVLGDGMLFCMSHSMGEDRLPSWEKIVAKLDRNKDGKIAPNECDITVGGIFTVLDINKDGFITEDEWNESLKLFNQADHGLFAIRAPIAAMSRIPTWPGNRNRANPTSARRSTIAAGFSSSATAARPRASTPGPANRCISCSASAPRPVFRLAGGGRRENLCVFQDRQCQRNRGR